MSTDLEHLHLLPSLTTWESLIHYFNKEIIINDSRSKTMPTEYTGTMIGITLDKVKVRRNNNTVEDIPLGHSKIKIYPK